ncbi:TetR family transcriptional regulator [Mangrovactinospora gilvigrisea]|uniref:TetR family transcriptional regulator n=1 Tax=Mangrovactinospora gilvigrisea TaxID=1428644 RepID=A0A1J7BJ57_9ACTN|nr:TetR/AcrR family transcriptional regulator [Mangrovactinospora gilvigrisea]OIV38711.1 TetR family transcriptional regulator [Mangrovactinospora gilvigrisea]
MNQERRERLGDAAIDVLARSGSRGLTHRAVDAAADVPVGTTKNYFPTRDALLRTGTHRIIELYAAIPRPVPVDRDGLAALLQLMLEHAQGPGRVRVLALLELQREATRTGWLSEPLDAFAAADFAYFEHAQRGAGLPVTPTRAATVTMALHAALPHLVADAPTARTAAGLDDLHAYVTGLLETVYGPPQRDR